MLNEVPPLLVTPDGRRRLQLRVSTIGVGVAVLVITGILMSLAWIANDRSNTSRLNLETAATLSAALPSLQPQLDDALNVVAATNSPADFRRFVGRQRTGGHRPFISESPWLRTSTGARLVANVGQPLRLVRDKATTAFFDSLRSVRRMPRVPWNFGDGPMAVHATFSV